MLTRLTPKFAQKSSLLQRYGRRVHFHGKLLQVGKVKSLSKAANEILQLRFGQSCWSASTKEDRLRP